MKDIKKIQYDASSEQIGLGIEYPIELDAKRRYAVGCYNPEDWDHIHEVLTKDGTIEDNIPCDCIECIDIKEHSSTRAVYLLNNQEAEDLKNHPKVKYVNEDFASYPIKYKPNPDDLKSTAIRNYRYPSPGTKQYRNWFDFNQLPTTGTYARPDTYSGGTLISYDGKFSGTSSACPVACGLIATKLQYNRSWTYADVRSWLQGAVGVGTTTRFDSGVESTTANAGTWSNVNSLEGGPMILLWDALTGNEPDDQPSVPSVGLSVSISGSLSFTGITIS